MSYPEIIKEAALEKMFHTDLSLRHIADELGIPRATLHGWKRKYQIWGVKFILNPRTVVYPILFRELTYRKWGLILERRQAG
jgi:hypothetical protein